MTPELMERIRDRNRRARKAEADGSYVCRGLVYEQRPKPWEPALTARDALCRIEDYPL